MAETPALRYPTETPPEAGQVLPIAQGVRWVRMPLPFALNHINLWLLDDGDRVVMIDCGIGDERTRDLWNLLLPGELRGRSVSRVMVTHLHPDHAGNARWLSERFAAPFHISQGDYLMAHAWIGQSAGYAVSRLVKLFRDHGLGEEWLSHIDLYRGDAYRRGVPEFPDGYRRLIDGDSIQIDGEPWQVIMGYGHAPEHASFYSSGRKVLISGDMVLPRITTNVSVSAVNADGNPLKRFIDSVRRMRELPDDTLVLPSHGLPFYGLHARVRQLIEHHDARFAELEEACVVPHTAAELIPTLFRRKLDAHGVFFAMGETLAHLNYLVEAGRVERVTDADHHLRFVRRSA